MRVALILAFLALLDTLSSSARADGEPSVADRVLARALRRGP
jgi:hypothetical protein